MAHSHYKDNRSTQRRVAEGTRRTGYRALGGVFAVVGVILLAFPIFRSVTNGSTMLWPDTRAFLGGGSSENVPPVEQVNCVAQRYGTGFNTGRAHTTWSCNIMLGTMLQPVAKPVPSGDPYAGMTKAQADSTYQQIVSNLASRPIDRGSDPTTLERELSSDRTGQLPTLRRLSALDAPARYGVVWGAGEMLLRWWAWLMEVIMFVISGLGSLFAARVAFRKAHTVRA